MVAIPERPREEELQDIPHLSAAKDPGLIAPHKRESHAHHGSGRPFGEDHIVDSWYPLVVHTVTGGLTQ